MQEWRVEGSYFELFFITDSRNSVVGIRPPKVNSSRDESRYSDKDLVGIKSPDLFGIAKIGNSLAIPTSNFYLLVALKFQIENFHLHFHQGKSPTLTTIVLVHMHMTEAEHASQ